MITISLCMIVKNEEAVLKRCLDSLHGLYDELIIVDTGSTDSTKEIAAQYTDKFFDFTWVNDFSKARNFAFSKCTMDYIYSADADEVLDEENRMRFTELKNNLLPEIEIVQMLYVNRHEFATTENFEKEYRPKLFKRLRTFTWIEPIHEMVNLNPVVYDSDIEILHMPTSLHSKRDLSIFERSISSEDSILSARLAGMYARELIKSGDISDFETAYPFFENAYYDDAHYPDLKAECCCVLSRYFRLCSNHSEFIKWSLRALTDNPCSEICYEYALFFRESGDFFEAIEWCEKALNNTLPIIDLECSGKKIYLLLSDIYTALSKDENAPIFCDFEEKASEYANMAKDC